MGALLWVMAGGAVGAGLRYGVALVLHRGGDGAFPFATLTVNVVGCFLIGLLSAGFASNWDVSETARLAIVVGVLGGFTTFSSFGNETLELYANGRWVAAGLYVLISNVAGLTAVWLGSCHGAAAA